MPNSKEKTEIDRILSLPDLVFNEHTYPTSAQIDLAYEILTINKVAYVKLSSESQGKTVNTSYKAKSLLTHPDKVLNLSNHEIKDSERVIAAFKKVSAAKTLLLHLATEEEQTSDQLSRWLKTFELAKEDFNQLVSKYRRKFYLVYCQKMIDYIRFCISNCLNYMKELRRLELEKIIRNQFPEPENTKRVNALINDLPNFYDEAGSNSAIFVDKMDKKNALLSLAEFEGKISIFKKLVSECKVTALKSQLKSVLTEYIKYSVTYCRYSIFHRHGETGRARATQFITQLCQESDETVIQTRILHYLKDGENGNTHAHSFRTMLINKLTGNKEYKSAYFNIYLQYLTQLWSPQSKSHVTNIENKLLDSLLKNIMISKENKPMHDTPFLVF